MKNVLFIAFQDLRYQLRQGSTLMWVFVMPPVFFYFIGTVTSGFSSQMSGETATPLAVVTERPGFLKGQVDRRLRENGFEPAWRETQQTPADDDVVARTLTIGPGMSDNVVLGEDPRP